MKPKTEEEKAEGRKKGKIYEEDYLAERAAIAEQALMEKQQFLLETELDRERRQAVEFPDAPEQAIFRPGGEDD